MIRKRAAKEKKKPKLHIGWQSCNIQHWMKEAQIALGWKPCVPVKPSPLLKKKKKKETSSLVFLASERRKIES